MIRSRSKKVLLVAPKAFPAELIAQYNTVRQVSVQTAIFPSIHEVKPDIILFDYEHMAADMEKILRRLQSNAYYRNIKICCYKNKEHTRVDGLLKVLGVNHFFYQEDVERVSKNKSALSAINSIIDASIVNWVAGVA
jgi:phosphoglycolate phosphatase-like HAD superfamily hydrolase